MHAPDHDAQHHVRRLLTLRQFPGFAEAELSELATIAENVVETTFPAGTVIASPTGRVPAIHLVVDGLLEAEHARHRWGPRSLFGAFEVMAGRRASSVVIAREPTTTLQVAARDFAELLEDNFSLLEVARRTLARRLLTLQRAREDACGAIVSAPATIDQRPLDRPLDLVDRLVTLRQLVPFTTSRIQALAALAQAAEDVTWAQGVRPCPRGDLEDHVTVIVSGALRAVRPDGRTELVTRLDAIGLLETLAERPHDQVVEALTPVRALRFPGAALLDVMEDHTDFALGLVSRLAAEVLDLVAVVDARLVGN